MAALNRFLRTDIGEIRIFSRDEKKQDDLRRQYSSPKLRFYIGDVRNRDSLESAMTGVDYVFHAAALKQVPSCEFYPMQAVLTNIIGTENVLRSAIKASVTKVVCLSTDKAVYPINAMGISKAMMEKVMIASSRNLPDNKTVICGTRYGNVMASRGSVIPLFINQVLEGIPITITDPNMTRFMMTLDDAIDLVLYAFDHANQGEIFVQKSPAASIQILATAIKDLLSRPEHPITSIGTRHGEKLYETLLTREEISQAQDLGDYFCIPPDTRDLNYNKYFEEGDSSISLSSDYNSHVVEQLDTDGMKNLLLKLPLVQSILNGDLSGLSS